MALFDDAIFDAVIFDTTVVVVGVGRGASIASAVSIASAARVVTQGAPIIVGATSRGSSAVEERIGGASVVESHARATVVVEAG